MIHILGVHGINTSENDDYGLEWQQTLFAAHGIQAAVTEARWESGGDIVGDIAKVVLSPSFRRRQIDRLAEVLHAFNYAVKDQKAQAVVVAHSMGQPLILAAERKLRSKGAGTLLPYVTLGGPLSHPVYGNALGMVGLGMATEQQPTAFYNYDDIVCAGPCNWVRLPSWMKNVRVAVISDNQRVMEHAAPLYLAHPLVAREICK